MSNLSLSAKNRVPKQKTQGVAGIVYGKDQASLPIEVDSLSIERLYVTAGHNRVVDLEIEGREKPIKVLFQEVQYDPFGRKIIHFDLHAVSLKEKIKADVPIHFTGESSAVIQHEGTLTTILDTLEVEAEPLSLPEKFTVDISDLKGVNDHISVSDVKVPQGAEILTDPELVIVKIDPITEEAEEEPEAVESEGETLEGGESDAENAAESPVPKEDDSQSSEEQ